MMTRQNSGVGWVFQAQGAAYAKRLGSDTVKASAPVLCWSAVQGSWWTWKGGKVSWVESRENLMEPMLHARHGICGTVGPWTSQPPEL